ncbi:hypothetical protein GGI20_004317 [Coemansia sp. BCRC 34301]|nr:hypothetical protein GGI20_004317 [Coemansia sp. BCRC 34301]
MLSGFVHLWLFDVAALTPPGEVVGEHTGAQPEAKAHEHHSHGAPAATTWFQGHILAGSAAKSQLTLTGVPAANPPPIHGCMVSDHDTPTFYDVYISEYCAGGPVVKYCAINVERSGGSGDAVELRLENGSQEHVTQHSSAHMLKRLKLSTTKMVSGERARSHLEKYAPGVLSVYADIAGSSSAEAMVVCLGVITCG